MPVTVPFLARFAHYPRTSQQQNTAPGSERNEHCNSVTTSPRPDRTRFTEVKDETTDDA